MELLLNIFWITFALLTVGLWWRDALAARTQRCCRLSQFVVLVCGLILLFPVISVTDDLHPLRPEMEESNRSRKIKGIADKSSPHPGVFGPLPAQVDGSFWPTPRSRVWGTVLTEESQIPNSPDLRDCACRAPPAVALA